MWYDVLLGQPDWTWNQDRDQCIEQMFQFTTPSEEENHDAIHSRKNMRFDCHVRHNQCWKYRWNASSIFIVLGSIWISNPCDAFAVLLGWDASIQIFTSETSSEFVSFQTSLNSPPFDRLKDPEWSSKKWTDITLHLLLISWFQSRLHSA